MTSETVRQAAAAQDLNHRDPAYLELIAEVKARLLSVYSPPASPSLPFTPYLIGGSGTAAVEAMISSCIQRGPALIIENGYYSARLRDIFDAHHIPYERLEFGWLEPWDLDTIEAKLESTTYEAVIATHNETTTGRLNPIADLGRLARRRGVRVLIDAMSSFGADDIDFADIDAICASANKCLHGIPGVAFVLVRDELAKQMRDYQPHTYYLSLPLYEGDNPRLTPPVPALMALRQALREMPEGGQHARKRNYVSYASQIRDRLRAHGLTLAVAPKEASCTLTTASIPSGSTPETWFAANRERGYMLYGCKGTLRDRYFQVANMGHLSDEHISGWLETVDDLLS
jgi:2-aminoethylphosphonate-pyruvate transaminase